MNLLDFRFDKHSSTGNDGIIREIFRLMGIHCGIFVEVGAWDGVLGSNCRMLYEQGWSGVFVEADPKRYASLCLNYPGCDRVVCINSRIGVKDSLFDDVVAPKVSGEIDFCSIDIDGLDVEVFDTFKAKLPRVVCIEGGQMLHPYRRSISSKKSKNNIQQSLGVMCSVFRNKGYEPICSYQDTFFVLSEYRYLFDVSENLMDLYLDGLVVLARRIPWIRSVLKRNNLSNEILDEIVRDTGYSKYGYSGRKRWAVERISDIQRVVRAIRDRYAATGCR